MESRRGEGGRGRTGKDADVEDVDIKVDGEGIALPSSYPVYGYKNGDGFGDVDLDGFGTEKRWSGRPQPSLLLRLIPKENLKKQNPISHGGTGIK